MLKHRKLLSPAQFGAVLGCDRYLTRVQLLSEFQYGYILRQNAAIRFGLDHESIALYYYSKLFKVEIQKPEFAIDPLNPKIGGIADGLINSDTGIEIKCHVGSHPMYRLSYKYLLQMAGYMYLYQRFKWILFSCTFHADHSLNQYKIFIVTWDQVKDRWVRDWYPILTEFVNQLSSKSIENVLTK